MVPISFLLPLLLLAQVLFFGGFALFNAFSDGAARADSDVPRNAALIERAGMSVALECAPLTDIACVPVQILTKNEEGPILLVLHDNEDEAFDASVSAIAAFGGTVIAVDSGERRRVRGVDPNRVFGRRAYAPFTAWIEARIGTDGPVLTLHNNADGHGQGRGTISINRERQGDAIRSFNHGDDEDNLIWTAGRSPLEENAMASALLTHLSVSGINFVYEQVERNRDYSLSNHVAMMNRPYFNVEAEHGDGARQLDMLRTLLLYLGYRPLAQDLS